MALAHELNDQKTAAGPDHGLAPAGGGCAADLVVYVEAGADQRRISDPAVVLETRAAGGAGTGQVTVFIEGEQADGVVVFDVDFRHVVRVLLAPIGELFPAPVGQQFRFGHALAEGEILCALANDHHVRRAFHHHTGNADGVENILNGGHAATVPVRGHDAGVERDDAVAVRVGADADGVYLRVGFGDHHALLGGVQGRAASGEDFPGFGVGHLPVFPGGNHHRADGFLGRGRRCKVG